MLNPMSEESNGPYRGKEEKMPMTTACRECRREQNPPFYELSWRVKETCQKKVDTYVSFSLAVLVRRSMSTLPLSKEMAKEEKTDVF